MGHSLPEEYKASDGKVFKYDARSILDIDGVDNACDAIVQAGAEGCKSVNDDIKKVQIGKETLCVADSSLEPALEEVGTYINSIATEGIAATTDSVKDEASKVFEQKQKEENERAKADRDAYESKLQAEKDKKSE